MLRQRLEALERALLPPAQDPAGNYPVEQEFRTRAYLVLAHAEFESYFEEACEKAAKEAQRKLRQGQISMAAVALGTYFSKTPLVVPDTFLGAKNAHRLALQWQARADACFDEYFEAIRHNDGIKQFNLVRLLAPLGIDPANLSAAMLVECDKLGKMRGNLAHGKAQQVVDPFSEKRTVDALEQFFTQLIALLATLT